MSTREENWRQQLQRFLRAYRATPHKSTGFAPATLMFNGRLYRTRLPTVKTSPSAFHEQVELNDGRAKAAMKSSADAKAYVKESNIQVGDQVLIRQPKINKTTPPFNPQPYEVLSRHGSKLKVQCQGQTLERHVNHCKRWQGEWQGFNISTATSSVKEGESTESESGNGIASEPPTRSETVFTNNNLSEPTTPSAAEATASPISVPASTSISENFGNETTRTLRTRSELQKPSKYRDTNFTQ